MRQRAHALGIQQACLGTAVALLAHHIYIELVASLLVKGDVYASLGNELPATLHGLGGAVVQNLQAIGALSYQRTQGYGYGQTHHARSRDTNTHGILEHIGTEANLYALGLFAQSLRGMGHTESHTHGFCTPDSGYHLSLYKSKDFILCHIWYRFVVCQRICW